MPLVAGEKGYTRDISLVEYIAPVGEEHLVKEIYDIQTNEEGVETISYGELRLVNNVIPTGNILARLDRELEDINLELDTARNTIQELKPQVAQLERLIERKVKRKKFLLNKRTELEVA